MNLKGLAQKKEIIFVFGRKLSLCASLWEKRGKRHFVRLHCAKFINFRSVCFKYHW
jgi:hypothetical protein